MQTKQIFITRDGVHHETADSGRRHLEKQFADELCKLARELCQLDGKYGPTVNFIADNLERFEELRQIRADADLQEEDSTD